MADMKKKLTYWIPEIAFAGIISLGGAVTGRRHKGRKNLRTNIYTVGIADTGEGKSDTTNYLSCMAWKAGLSYFLGSDTINSGQALMHEVIEKPSQLIMIDEFGDVLSYVSGSKQGSPQKLIKDNIVTLYGKSKTRYKVGFLKTDPKAKRLVVCPNLCILGITTESSYISSIKTEDFETGFLNRFVVFEAPGGIAEYTPPIKQAEDPSPCDNVAELWKVFTQGLQACVMEDGEAGYFIPDEQDDIKSVPMEDANFYSYFEEQWVKKKRAADKESTGIWARGCENSLKIAMIIALLRGGKLVITNNDLILSGEIVLHTCFKMLDLKEKSENNTQHSRDLDRIINYVKKRGTVTARDLFNSVRMEPGQRDRHLKSLRESGEFQEIIETPEKGGHPKIFYKYLPKA